MSTPNSTMEPRTPGFFFQSAPQYCDARSGDTSLVVDAIDFIFRTPDDCYPTMRNNWVFLDDWPQDITPRHHHPSSEVL
jgi:hypothetical protein